MFEIKDFQFVIVLDLILAVSYYCGSLSFSAKLFWGFGSVSSMFFVHVKKKIYKKILFTLPQSLVTPVWEKHRKKMAVIGIAQMPLLRV